MKKKVTLASDKFIGVVELGCESCNRFGPVLFMDCSYGEYTPKFICPVCIDRLFATWRGYFDRQIEPPEEAEK